MKYMMPIKKEDFIIKILDIFSCMPPFSSLSIREKEIFAIYAEGYLALKDKYDKIKIFNILFDYNFTKRISDKLTERSGSNVTMDNVRNYITKLRHKGFLDSRSIPDKFLYLFDNLGKEITFILELKD